MFKAGQKVVFIKGSETLIINEVYTIKEIIYNGAGVTLFEVNPITFSVGFHIWRFRSIDDNWVEELLCKLMSEVEADELVSA